jgi:hypothetical protein
MVQGSRKVMILDAIKKAALTGNDVSSQEARVETAAKQ